MTLRAGYAVTEYHGVVREDGRMITRCQHSHDTTTGAIECGKKLLAQIQADRKAKRKGKST